MTWWRPWSWFQRPANGHESRAALEEQIGKLDEVKAREAENRQRAARFTAEVQAALARRRHQ